MDKETLQSLKELLREELGPIKTSLEENTRILRALEHSSEVNKAEHDKIINDITHIKGNVEGLRKDLANVEIIISSNWNEIAKLKLVK